MVVSAFSVNSENKRRYENPEQVELAELPGKPAEKEVSVHSGFAEPTLAKRSDPAKPQIHPSSQQLFKNVSRSLKLSAFLHSRVFSSFDVTFGDVSMVILIIAYNLIFVQGAFHSGDTNRAGKTLGSLIQWNVLLMFLFVTKNSFIMYLLNYSFDRVIHFHRWLGWYLVWLTLGHFLLFLIPWLEENSVTENLFQDSANLFGFISFCALVVLGLSAFEEVRRRLYEVFYYSHVVFFALFIIFGILHMSAGSFIAKLAVPVLLWAGDWVYRVVRFKRVSVVSCTVMDGGRIVKLELDRPSEFDYKTAQYAFVRIPKLSALQWHPLTICSKPNQSTLRFYIRVGNWTAPLASGKISLNSSDHVILDGPYGKPRVPVDKYSHVLLFGGGVGIAGVLPYAHWIADLCKQPSGNAYKTLELHWSCRDVELINDLLADLAAISHAFKVHVHYTGNNNNALHQSAISFYKTRIDVGTVMATRADKGGHTAVVTCGPVEMQSEVQRTASKLSRSTDVTFDVHTEAFQF